MRFKYHHINLLLLLVSSLFLVKKGLEYKCFLDREEAVISSLISTESRLVNSLKICEELCLIKNRSIEYYDIENYPVYEPKGRYWDLKKDIEFLYWKLGSFSSQVGCGLDKFGFVKDALTSDVYFTAYGYYLDKCEAHSIDINNQRMPFERNMTYRVSIYEDLEIEYCRYIPNNLKGQIDTIRAVKRVDHKTLYSRFNR